MKDLLYNNSNPIKVPNDAIVHVGVLVIMKKMFTVQ